MSNQLARVQLFKNTTGAFGYWTKHGFASANFHPDRCVCQAKEKGMNAGTPHQHYQEPPYRCARCMECDGYEPALPFYWETEIMAALLEAIGLYGLDGFESR